MVLTPQPATLAVKPDHVHDTSTQATEATY